MRRVAEQHRWHGSHPQAVGFYRGYRNTVADAAVDHQRLHRNDIRLQRAVRIVEEHRLYFTILPHLLLLWLWTAGERLTIIVIC